jgi:DNA ligase (NAD+)
LVEEGETYLMCTNDACIGLRIGNLYKWIKALKIMDISDKTIELLVNKGLVKEPCDFYKLKAEQIQVLERMGERSAKKIVENFGSGMEIPLDTFVDGLNIANFSGSRAELLIESGYNTIGKMLNVKVSDLIKIKGIETKTANAIVDGLKSKENIINNLLDVGIKIIVEEKEEIKMASNKLAGKSFCFTGGINRVDDDGKRFTRERMQALVMENGGSVMDSVKKGLTYLVQADPSSQSSKTKKAEELEVQIVSEANFFKMIGM